MKSINNNQTSQNDESLDINVAKLSLIGSALSTLGDGLQTIAAGIALQELEKNNANQKHQSTPTNLDPISQLEKMQQNIDHLTRKIERLERGND